MAKYCVKQEEKLEQNLVINIALRVAAWSKGRKRRLHANSVEGSHVFGMLIILLVPACYSKADAILSLKAVIDWKVCINAEDR